MTADPASQSALQTWFEQRLTETAQHWRGGVSDPSGPVALVRTLRDNAYPVQLEVLEAARDALHRANYGYAWSELARLRPLAPEAFDRVTDEQLVSDCEQWLLQQFAEPEDIRDTDELWSIRRSAEAMGVDVDEAAYDDAYAAVQAREGGSVAEPDDVDPNAQSDSLSPAHEERAIDALFARLAEPDVIGDGSL